MKTDEREQARELRARGWSIKEIEERRALIEKTRLGPIVAAARKSALAREQRRAYQLEGRRLARERDPSYLSGRMLYWAEGAKERNSVRIVNSDRELLIVFAAFLRAHFDVADEAMRVRCNLFADDDDERRAIERYWLECCGFQRRVSASRR